MLAHALWQNINPYIAIYSQTNSIRAGVTTPDRLWAPPTFGSALPKRFEKD